MAATLMRTGERLSKSGLIAPDVILRTLEQATLSATPLGAALAAATNVPPRQFYRELAEQLSLTFIDLSESSADKSLLRSEHLDFYLHYNALPLSQSDGTLTMATTNPDESLIEHAQARYPECVITLQIASPRDIIRILTEHFGEQMLHESCYKLYQTMPQRSAYQSLPHYSGITLLGVLAVLATLVALQPIAVLTGLLVLMNLFYLVSIGFKCLLYSAQRRNAPTTALPAKDQLPVYSILIPLYDEARSVPGLIAAMRNLNYPKHLLDIKLILEQEDDATLQAIIAQKPENYFDIIRVPKAQPQTKPKACNYALRFAKGDFVTIYDAEDRPDPNQLRLAAGAFATASKNTVCLQARLNYYNQNENILTRWFSIEYASLFDILLPGLHRLGLPVPLGGTSNHFRLERLKAIGGWDPFNVTEDADLGIRLCAEGLQTAMLPSITMEESPVTVGVWMKQRSRWIKGYIQTWLVYMRSANKSRETLGWKSYASLQIFVGLPAFLFISAPFFWLIFLGSVSGVLSMDLPIWLVAMCITMLIAGLLNHWFFALLVCRQWRWKNTAMATVTYPFYWFLHIPAGFLAVYQLIFKPHYWEKTPHGLSKFSEVHS